MKIRGGALGKKPPTPGTGPPIARRGADRAVTPGHITTDVFPKPLWGHTDKEKNVWCGFLGAFIGIPPQAAPGNKLFMHHKSIWTYMKTGG